MMILLTGSWQLANFLHAIQSSKAQWFKGLITGVKKRPTRYNSFMEQALLTGSWLSCINFLLFKDSKIVTADCQTKWKAQQIQQSQSHKNTFKQVVTNTPMHRKLVENSYNVHDGVSWLHAVTCSSERQGERLDSSRKLIVAKYLEQMCICVYHICNSCTSELTVVPWRCGSI